MQVVGRQPATTRQQARLAIQDTSDIALATLCADQHFPLQCGGQWVVLFAAKTKMQVPSPAFGVRERARTSARILRPNLAMFANRNRDLGFHPATVSGFRVWPTSRFFVPAPRHIDVEVRLNQPPQWITMPEGLGMINGDRIERGRARRIDGKIGHTARERGRHRRRLVFIWSSMSSTATCVRTISGDTSRYH